MQSNSYQGWSTSEASDICFVGQMAKNSGTPVKPTCWNSSHNGISKPSNSQKNDAAVAASKFDAAFVKKPSGSSFGGSQAELMQGVNLVRPSLDNISEYRILLTRLILKSIHQHGHLTPNNSSRTDLLRGRSLEDSLSKKDHRRVRRDWRSGLKASDEDQVNVHSVRSPSNIRNKMLERDEGTQLQPLQSSPPLNAPTEPASLRRPLNVTAQANASMARKSQRLGSWSQSERWVSNETKERMAFHKMSLNLHYMGADKSPFIPQNPAELTALKAEFAESQRVRLANEVNRRLKTALSRKAEREAGIATRAHKQVQLFHGKNFADNLSSIFAVQNCFNKDASSDKNRPDWPSLAELKEEGDKRVAQYRRYFPLPRVNTIGKVQLQDQRRLYNSDGSIRWENKAIKLSSRVILPVSSSEESPIGDVPDLRLEELPETLKEIIQEIEGEGVEM